MSEGDILDMLERLGKAVSDGDLKTVAACYGYPALFLSDELVILLENAEQVKESFGEGRKRYIDQGILTTRPELLNYDQISDGIVSVDVRWPGFDSEGNENYTESSHYLIHNEGGQPLIRAAASRKE